MIRFALAVCLSIGISGCNNGPDADPEDQLQVTSQSLLGGSGRYPLCSADAIDSGNGWGWDNEQSCEWPGAFAAYSAPPECSSTALDHGDGWGWENGQSCLWGNATQLIAESSSLDGVQATSLDDAQTLSLIHI